MKVASLVLLFVGLLTSALSEFGYLTYQDRIAFYERLFHTTEAIPRSAKGFDAFLVRFPPAGSASASVSAIAARILTMDNDGRDVWSSVRYIIDGQIGDVVAVQADVQAWAFKTMATRLGLLVAFIGFLIRAFEFVVEKRPKGPVQPCAAPNGGPAAPVENSSVTEGPPSVS
jgi:hypothetical protein